jgi:hypothetical protein
VPVVTRGELLPPHTGVHVQDSALTLSQHGGCSLGTRPGYLVGGPTGLEQGVEREPQLGHEGVQGGDGRVALAVLDLRQQAGRDADAAAQVAQAEAGRYARLAEQAPRFGLHHPLVHLLDSP